MRIKKLIKTAALTIAALTMITSFSPATYSNPVASRFNPVISAQAKTATRLNYTKLFLQCGQKKRLKVKGYRGKVRFSSGSKFVQVNPATGSVIASSVGKAIVKAKAGKKIYKCAITVVPKRTTKYKDVKITYKLKKSKGRRGAKTVEVGKYNVVTMAIKNTSKETPITFSNLLEVFNGKTCFEFRNAATTEIAPGTTKTVQYTLNKGYATTKGNSSFIALYHRKPRLVKLSHDFSKGQYSYWEQLDFSAGSDVLR